MGWSPDEAAGNVTRTTYAGLLGDGHAGRHSEADSLGVDEKAAVSNSRSAPATSVSPPLHVGLL